MSDFTHPFWSIFISAITVAGILGCAWLLWINLSKKGEVEQHAAHVWDEDLSELNNPLPLWWVGLFVITILFGFVYLALFPGLGSNKGLLGWTSHGQYDREQTDAAKRYDPIYKAYAGVGIPQLATDAKAHAIGERLFLNYCAQCHGSDAKGGKGFPNLVHHDWIWGGEPARIEETIMNGRTNAMPPLGDAIGGPDGVDDMANYIHSISGQPFDAARADRAKPKFALCASCHGADAMGNPMAGFPRLAGRADKVWLYGGSLATIKETITNGRTNEMPAWGDRLGADRVHLLAAYVWSLSHRSDNAGAVAQ